MAKESVILNEIDVSECSALCCGNTCFLAQHYSFTEAKHKEWCKDNPNCDYKQLQRMKNKRTILKDNLLFINREIVQIANDGLTHHVIRNALLGLNSIMADLIRNL